MPSGGIWLLEQGRHDFWMTQLNSFADPDAEDVSRSQTVQGLVDRAQMMFERSKVKAGCMEGALWLHCLENGMHL